MYLLEKSKSDKKSEKNMEGENFGPSRQTEVSESDNHEDDNTGNEGPGPSRQMSASCSDKRKDSPWKRKMETSSSNLEKKIKRSRIETDASRIEEDAIVNEQFSCEHCEAKFPSTWSLRIHSAKKHKDKYQPHTCYECNIRFKSSSALHEHNKRNHKIVKYECKICGKQFIIKSNLTKHLQTHNNERNFLCGFCPKAFKNIYCRNAHMKIHTLKEEDKYECDVCGKRFGRKGNLKRHKRTEHPEKDSPTNEQRDHSLEKSDAQLSPSQAGSTFGQDLQRRQKKIDLEQQKNDSQESKRDMDEISEHENEPENFIHCQSEIGDKEHDSQSDTEIFRKNSNSFRFIKLKNYSSRFNLI